MKEPVYKRSKSYLICGLIGVVGVIYLGISIFIYSVTPVIDVSEGERTHDGVSIFNSIQSSINDMKHSFAPVQLLPILLVVILFLVLAAMFYFMIKDNFLNDNFRKNGKEEKEKEENPAAVGVVVNTVFGEEEESLEKPADETDVTDDIEEDAPIEIKEVTDKQKRAAARRRRLNMRGPLGSFFRFEDRHKYIARVLPAIFVILIYIGLYHTPSYKEIYNSTTEVVANWEAVINQYKVMNMETDMVAEVNIGLGFVLMIAGIVFYIGAFCFNFILDTLNED